MTAYSSMASQTCSPICMNFKYIFLKKEVTVWETRSNRSYPKAHSSKHKRKKKTYRFISTMYKMKVFAWLHDLQHLIMMRAENRSPLEMNIHCLCYTNYRGNSYNGCVYLHKYQKRIIIILNHSFAKQEDSYTTDLFKKCQC